MNLAGRFLELMAERGSRPAVREANGRVTTYAELRRQIIGFAAHLRSLGLSKGDPAVIQAPNGAAFAIATIAVASLGGVAVLAEPGLGDDVYVKRLHAAKPKWTIVHPAVLWANRIPSARAFLRRREVLVPPVLPDTTATRRVMISRRILEREAAASDATAEVTDVEADDDLTIIFTGGTTSMPKGVRLSHGSTFAAISNIAVVASETLGGSAARGTGRIELRPRTMLADTPQQVLYGLVLGQEVLVTRGRMQRRAAMVRKLVEEGRTGAYFGSPFLWMEMMEQAGAKRSRLPPGLDAVFLGGAPVTREFLKTLRDWLHPDTKVTAIYGLTEAGPVAYATAEEKLAWTGEGDFIGWLMSGMDADRTPSGEIIISGPSLFLGYIGQEARAPGEGFPTGDLGAVVDIGGRKALTLLGRAKDMIIRAGVNIYPSTLESDLRAIADETGRRLLREAALVGLWNEAAQDEVVVLAWQPMAGMTVDEAFLTRQVERITGTAAGPDYMMRVDPMPVTGRQNKVDKATLRARAAERFGLAATPRGQSPQ
ncbi:MAG: class I adenylate-forming enzyme family protein [Bauldia sp.]